VDPDGNLDGVYVNENGNFLGTDNNTDDHTVYVTSQETWDEVGGQEGANTAEGTQKLQSSDNTVALDQYTADGGINITDETWANIEEEGGEMISPTVDNQSDKDVFYKPESDVGNLKDNDAGRVAPGNQIYVPIDGVKTKKWNNQVFKVTNSCRVQIDSKGNVIVSGGNWLLQNIRGGWKDKYWAAGVASRATKEFNWSKLWQQETGGKEKQYDGLGASILP
ncbi:MAG: hypothetical protein AAFQ92_24510, partial [Bacteroidota bacterium]